MATGVVYTLNDKNEITDEIEMDYNDAIALYWGKRTPKGGRYFVGVKGIKPPYKRKNKPLKDIRNPTRQEV